MKNIELAKQAGWEYAHNDSGFEPLWEFAALVEEAARAEEREACAKLCDEVGEESTSQWPNRLANMIRARSKA